MIYNTFKRNTPVATLIKNYLNKKSGKVAVSRDEIQRRFEYLDWKDQKKILMASLDSCKSDRYWAYRKLLNYWDKSFEPKVKEVWEKLHEPMCSKPIIRFFPITYVKEHLDSFTEERDFYYISIRFAEDPNYVIEKNKLSKAEYLGVLYYSGRTISSEEANDILYEIVHDLCIEGFSYHDMQNVNYTEGRISPNNFRNIDYAKYYLGEMNNCQAVWVFEDWAKKVQKYILESTDYKAIMSWENPFDCTDLQIKLLRKYSYLALSPQYKLPTDTCMDEFLKSADFCQSAKPEIMIPKIVEPQPPSDPEYLEKMQVSNPALKKLMDEFDLEPDLEELPF